MLHAPRMPRMALTLSRSFGRYEIKVPILLKESGKPDEGYWLHSIVDPEQIEGTLLQGRGSGNQVEGRGSLVAGRRRFLATVARSLNKVWKL